MPIRRVDKLRSAYAVIAERQQRLEDDERNTRAARRQLELFMDDGIRERITVALALLDENVERSSGRLAGTLKHVGKAGSSRKAKWPAHKTYWAMKMPDQFTNERAWRRGIINLTEYRMAGGNYKRRADPDEIAEELAAIEAWRFKALSAYLERGDQ